MSTIAIQIWVLFNLKWNIGLTATKRITLEGCQPLKQKRISYNVAGLIGGGLNATYGTETVTWKKKCFDPIFMRCKGSYAQSKSLKVVNKQHPKINQPKSFPKPCPNELHCQQINCYCTLWQECSQKDTIEKVSSKTQ